VIGGHYAIVEQQLLWKGADIAQALEAFTLDQGKNSAMSFPKIPENICLLLEMTRQVHCREIIFMRLCLL